MPVVRWGDEVESGKQSVVEELQMITGIMSDDIDYLVYCLLKGGKFFQQEKRVGTLQEIDEVEGVEDLTEWFNRL